MERWEVQIRISGQDGWHEWKTCDNEQEAREYFEGLRGSKHSWRVVVYRIFEVIYERITK